MNVDKLEANIRDLTDRFGLDSDGYYDGPYGRSQWADIEWAAHEVAHFLCLSKRHQDAILLECISYDLGSVIGAMSPKASDMNEARALAVEMNAFHMISAPVKSGSLVSFAAKNLRAHQDDEQWLQRVVSQYRSYKSTDRLARCLVKVLQTGKMPAWVEQKLDKRQQIT